MEALAGQGISFKVVSGDNPETVRGTVRHLHLPFAEQAVMTGDEVAAAGGHHVYLQGAPGAGKTMLACVAGFGAATV